MRVWDSGNFKMICATAKDAETKYGVDLIIRKGDFILNIYIDYRIIILKFFLR